MITKLGKILRKLRIDHDQNLMDMANILEVSSAFLSAVENGKKSAPDNWAEKLNKHYKLTNIEYDEIKQAIEESKRTITLEVFDADDNQKELAVCFARSFKKLSTDDMNKIGKILNRR